MTANWKRPFCLGTTFWFSMCALAGSKTAATFTEGRSYGAFYADDVDGDGLTEFIVISDSPSTSMYWPTVRGN